MIIAIPTMGRADNQTSLGQIPPKWRRHVHLVCPPDETDAYTLTASGAHVTPHPADVRGIAAVRQWAVDNLGRYVFLCDDDLVFHKRDEGQGGKLVAAGMQGVGEMLTLMDHWLRKTHLPAVGVTSRFGNPWLKGDYQECFRPCMAYGFDTRILKCEGIRFTDVEVCEDYHVHLSLLRRGLKNRMSLKFTATDTGVGKAGGTTSYRTATMVRRSMERFVEMHKPFAEFRETKSKTQGHDIGIELKVHWKKAYRHALAKKSGLI